MKAVIEKRIGTVTRYALAGALVLLAGSRAVEAASNLRTVAGDGTAGFQDGDQARFNKPIRLAPHGMDAVLVADIYNHAIRVVRLSGQVETLAGAPDRKGFLNGAATTAQFASPHGVAVSSEGVIAVAEAENHTIRLLSLEDGGYSVSTLAGVPGQEGLRDGAAEQALFKSPHAVAWAEDGALLVADIGNARIRRVHHGEVTTVAGADGEFVYPMDIAFGPEGVLWIVDAGTHRLLRLTGGKVVEMKVDQELHTPHGVTVDPNGVIYIADMRAHRVLRVLADGHTEMVAGTGEPGSDGASLQSPAAVLAHAGHLWIADLDNHRIRVLDVDEE